MKLLFSPVSENFSHLTNAIRSQLFPRTFVTIVQWIGVEGLRVIQTGTSFLSGLITAHVQRSFWIQRQKGDDLSPKSFFFLTSKQHFAIHFSLLNCNVCPLAIPEILAQTQESYYRQLIHSGFSCTVKNWRKSRCKKFSQVLIQQEVTV